MALSSAWCYLIKQIVCLTAKPPIVESEPFPNVKKADCLLFVPDESVSAYEADAYWSAFAIRPQSQMSETAIDQPETDVTAAAARSYTLSGRTATAGERGVVIQDGRKKVAR